MKKDNKKILLLVTALFAIVASCAIFSVVHAEKIVVEGGVVVMGADEEMLGRSVTAVPVMKRDSSGNYVYPRTSGDDICLDDGTTCLSSAGGGSGSSGRDAETGPRPCARKR